MLVVTSTSMIYMHRPHMCCCWQATQYFETTDLAGQGYLEYEELRKILNIKPPKPRVAQKIAEEPHNAYGAKYMNSYADQVCVINPAILIS